MSPKLFGHHSLIHNVFPPKVDYDLRLDGHDFSLTKEFFWSDFSIYVSHRPHYSTQVWACSPLIDLYSFDLIRITYFLFSSFIKCNNLYSIYLYLSLVVAFYNYTLILNIPFFQNHSTADSNSQEDDSTNNACCSQPSLILMCLMYSCVSRIVCILHSGLIPIWQTVKFREAAFFASKWLKIYIFVIFFNRVAPCIVKKQIIS